MHKHTLSIFVINGVTMPKTKKDNFTIYAGDNRLYLRTIFFRCHVEKFFLRYPTLLTFCIVSTRFILKNLVKTFLIQISKCVGYKNRLIIGGTPCLSMENTPIIDNNCIQPAVDPETSGRGGGGARNMKYKPPCTAAILFWPIFYRPGGHGPLGPLDPLLPTHFEVCLHSLQCIYKCMDDYNIFQIVIVIAAKTVTFLTPVLVQEI